MDGTRGPDLARGPDFADPCSSWIITYRPRASTVSDYAFWFPKFACDIIVTNDVRGVFEEDCDIMMV